MNGSGRAQLAFGRIEEDMRCLATADENLRRAAHDESPSSVGWSVRAVNHVCRSGRTLGLTNFLALLPGDVSAERCIEFDQVVVILDGAQFVFFAQFNRHQPGSTPVFCTMPFDVRGKFVNIRASIVRLDPFGVVRLIGAECAKIRCLSGVEIAPLNVIGKCEGRYFYVAHLNVPLFREISAFRTIDGQLATVSKFFEVDGGAQRSMATCVDAPGSAAC